MKHKKNCPTTRDLAIAFRRLGDAFATEFCVIGEHIVIDSLAFRQHQTSFKDDPAGLEAFLNHVHIEELVSQTLPLPANYAALVEIAERLMRVWSDRMAPLLKQRQVLFYIGGVDTVSVRFHIERDGEPAWMDISDTQFLRSGENTGLAI